MFSSLLRVIFVLGGPFAAVFGARLGASISASSAEKKVLSQKLAKLGLSPEIVEQAALAGKEAADAQEALAIVVEAADSARELAGRLEEEVLFLYSKAKECLESGDQDEAKKFLLKRELAKERQKKALRDAIANKARKEQVEANVKVMENP